MAFNALLALVNAVVCTGLAVFVLWVDPRSFTHRTFAIGMGILASMEVFAGLGAQSVFSADVIGWEQLNIMVSAFMPGTWLLFSLSFSRSNYRELVAQWRWYVLAAYVLPLALVALFNSALFTGTAQISAPSVWSISFAWAGYVCHIILLLSSVFVLVNLERTLRAFTGSMRWQIKFMLLGLGSIFAVQIYTSSQALLFASMTSTLKAIYSCGLFIGNLLIAVSLARQRLFNVDIYLSRTILYNSMTVLVVGIYLVAIGALAKVIDYLGGSQMLPLGAFFAFLAVVGLIVLLLSDTFRHRVKRFINLNFYRSSYDYRKEWTTFTQCTASVMEVKGFCAAVSKMVSETFTVPSVTIWLWDEEAQDPVSIGSSTVFSDTQSPMEYMAVDITAFGLYMREQAMPIDIEVSSERTAEGVKMPTEDFFSHAQIRYGVSLVASQQLLGFMTLGNRLTRGAFSAEDFNLLKTVADQVAAHLLNLRLSQRLLKAKEMEAFQTLSAFFVHDLKNLAAKLSLMVQNLPAHYDNPAFRDDMMRVISGSVAKMNAMCNRLSLLTQRLELHRIEADLNDLIRLTLAELDGSLNASLRQELSPLPPISVDTEQIQKVLMNLILNANEAVGEQGEIYVKSEQDGRWAVLSVRDNGCGMPQEFITKSLFQPFQTTKSEGLGIGLFHTKMLVEAHQGRIEVESVEGLGTTFRVLLPSTPIAAGVGDSRDQQLETVPI